jgi:hypothetical protein
MHLPMLAGDGPGRAIDDADNGSCLSTAASLGMLVIWDGGVQDSPGRYAGSARPSPQGAPCWATRVSCPSCSRPGLVPLNRALGVAVTSPGRPRSPHEAVKRSIRG